MSETNDKNFKGTQEGLICVTDLRVTTRSEDYGHDKVGVTVLVRV